MVNGGLYDGYALRLHVTSRPTEMGPMPAYHFYFLEKEGESTVVLSAISTPPDEVWPHFSSLPDEMFLMDEKSLPSGLFPPERLELNGQVFFQIASDFGWRDLGTRLTNEEAARVTSLPSIGMIPDFGFLRIQAKDAPTFGIDGAFFAVGPDGRRTWYDAQIPFWRTIEDLDSMYGVPNITWDGGQLNRETYVRGHMGGCGATAAVYERDPKELGELVQTGTYFDPATQKRRSVFGPSASVYH